MGRPNPQNPRLFFLLLGIAFVILFSACGDDEETRPEDGFGETETQSAVIFLNGIQILSAADVGVSDDPMEVPVRLEAENTISITVNNDNGAMESLQNSYPCWGTLQCPWKNTRLQEETYDYTFPSEAGQNFICMGTLVLTPSRTGLSFKIDYETGPTGPVFSGPQQYPFLCRTEDSHLGQPLPDNGDENGGVGIPVYSETDEIIGYSRDCSTITRIEYFYKSTEDGEFKPLDINQDVPEDLAETTTSDGLTVDYIVRVERGTINRFIYAIAMLATPDELDGLSWDLTAWNGKLVYRFEGGVAIGHQQGRGTVRDVLYDDVLSEGYAVAHSTGTVTGTHYNLNLSEETMMMVKDHFIERYGTPEYTVGVGGSGGGIQQYAIGQSQHLPALRHHDPYLLDAGIPQYSYSDMITQAIYVGDCMLLEYYFDVVAPNQGDTTFGGMHVFELGNLRLPLGWLGSVLPRAWIEGLSASDTVPHPVWSPLGEELGRTDFVGSTECVNGWLGLTPLAMNPLWTDVGYDHLPPDVVAEFDAVKWTHWNDLENVYGVDEEGHAPFTWDNVGVQYGLQALKEGNITMDQFLDINAKVGSWKPMDEMVPEGVPFKGGIDLETIPGILDLLTDFDLWSIRNANLQPNQYGVAPRLEADLDAIHTAYTSGHVFTGKIDIPLIDARHYLDPFLDMHHAQQSFATRQRMIDGQGHADNQVIWFVERPYNNVMMAFHVIDEWMTNIQNNPDLSVAENKPAAAVDKCFDGEGDLIGEGSDVWDGILNDEPEGACTQAFPLYSTSRIVAGGNIKGDVFKCHLQTVDEAIDAGVYEGISLTEQNIARLKEIFPTGVCDYTRGDVGRPAGW